jgi:hypothetical protein
MTAVRVVVFGYAALWLILRFRYVLDVANLPDRRFHPVGVLVLLERPPATSVVVAVWAVTFIGCGACVAGRSLRWSAPTGAAGMLFLATFTSSFGQVFHTEHLLALHLLVLAAGVLVEPPAPSDGETSGWPLNLMMCIVVLTYVLAGVAKLRWSGADWVSGDVLRNWIAVDNLRKILFDDLHSPVGGWLSGIGWIWMPIAAATLMVELGAPIALLTGRIRTVWLVAAWGFHVGVFALMAISFPYQLTGVAFASFLRMEIIAERVRPAVALRRPVRFGLGGRTP